MKEPIDEMKVNIQATLEQAKDRSEGLQSEINRLKECVEETKLVVTETKQSVMEAGEVLYTQKRYKRLLNRNRKTKPAKAGSR
ncbi:hypothetical protein [Paenibacillus sp. FSL E2-0201]|uniref:hypothetical protein n=1 Tax=Paenibacillus sp. FSL E2-0201 TaxID=2954726 RepID=UPI0030D9D2F9